jgi:hypothetical protein
MHFPRRSLFAALLLVSLLPLLSPTARAQGDIPSTPETVSYDYHSTLNYYGLQLMNAPGLFALGGGTVALRGRSGALDVNPAAIGQDGLVMAGLDTSGEYPLASNVGGELYLSSPFVMAKRGRWAAGLQFKRLSYGTFERRSPDGESLGETELLQWSLKAFGAYDISDHWTVGAGLGYAADQILEPLDGDAARSILLDLGVLGTWTYATDGGTTLSPSVGASLMNFGWNSDVDVGSDRSAALDPPAFQTPSMLRAGGALNVASGSTWNGRPVVRVVGHAALSKMLVGSEITQTSTRSEERTYGPFEALTRSWGESAPTVVNASDDVGDQPVSPWGQIVKHVGAEITLYGIASLRAGRRQVDERFSRQRYTTIGGGVDLVYLRIDYAQTLGSPIGFYGDFSFLRVTAQIPLDGSYENKWW